MIYRDIILENIFLDKFKNLKNNINANKERKQKELEAEQNGYTLKDKEERTKTMTKAELEKYVLSLWDLANSILKQLYKDKLIEIYKPYNLNEIKRSKEFKKIYDTFASGNTDSSGFKLDITKSNGFKYTKKALDRSTDDFVDSPIVDSLDDICDNKGLDSSDCEDETMYWFSCINDNFDNSKYGNKFVGLYCEFRDNNSIVIYHSGAFFNIKE